MPRILVLFSVLYIHFLVPFFFILSFLTRCCLIYWYPMLDNKVKLISGRSYLNQCTRATCNLSCSVMGLWSEIKIAAFLLHVLATTGTIFVEYWRALAQIQVPSSHIGRAMSNHDSRLDCIGLLQNFFKMVNKVSGQFLFLFQHELHTKLSRA